MLSPTPAGREIRARWHEVIDIVVVSYRTPDYLARCLGSIPHDHRTIVVENGACLATTELIEHRFPWVELILPSENTGFGGGVQTALRRCNTPTALVLNADTELSPDAPAKLEAYLSTHPSCAIVGPRIVGDGGSLQPSCFPWPSPLDYFLSEVGAFEALRRLGVRSDLVLRLWDHSADRTVPWVLGCAFALRRSAYDQIGGFDPGYALYFEEVDLCRRLRSAGWDVAFTPSAEVRHTGAVSTSAAREDMAVQFHASLYRWYRRHRPDALGRLRLAVLASLPPRSAKAAMTAVLGAASSRADLRVCLRLAHHWPPDPVNLT